jgi:hypothetical protein
MKLIIKLAIAALLANAVFRLGNEYLAHVKFREAVRDAAMFKARDNDQLRTRIGQLASEYDIPQDPSTLDISREERHVVVHGEYTKDIEFVPSYRYPWTFSWDVDVVIPAAYIPPR